MNRLIINLINFNNAKKRLEGEREKSYDAVRFLLNIDNRDNRLGATTILIIDIFFLFDFLFDYNQYVMTLSISKKGDAQ